MLGISFIKKQTNEKETSFIYNHAFLISTNSIGQENLPSVKVKDLKENQLNFKILKMTVIQL